MEGPFFRSEPGSVHQNFCGPLCKHGVSLRQPYPPPETADDITYIHIHFQLA
jgi:hypothetical protein